MNMRRVLIKRCPIGAMENQLLESSTATKSYTNNRFPSDYNSSLWSKIWSAIFTAALLHNELTHWVDWNEENPVTFSPETAPLLSMGCVW